MFGKLENIWLAFGTGHSQGVELTSLPPWPQHLLHALNQAAAPGQHYGVACDEHLSALQIVRRDVGCRPVTDMAATLQLRSSTRELAPWSPVDMLCSLLPLSMDIASGLQEQQIRSHPSAAAGNGRRWCSGRGESPAGERDAAAAHCLHADLLQPGIGSEPLKEPPDCCHSLLPRDSSLNLLRLSGYSDPCLPCMLAPAASL